MRPDFQPRLVEPSVIEGETTLFGEVERVGGAEPKVALRLPDGSSVYCEVTKEQARELGKRLYQPVCVVGTATWRLPTYIIEAFRLHKVTDYEDTPPSVAISELARVLAPHWADVDDVVAEVERLRHGGLPQ
jgi:hypothetical protein